MVMILAFGIMLLAVGAMAIGVLMGRAPITGSCGGLANLGIDGECEICGGNPAACPTDNNEPGVSSRAKADLVSQEALTKLGVHNADKSSKPHLDA